MWVVVTVIVMTVDYNIWLVIAVGTVPVVKAMMNIMSSVVKA